MKVVKTDKNTAVRIVESSYVQKFVDNIDFMYPLRKITEQDIDDLKKYFRENNIPIPVIPNDDRSDSIFKNMYRVWVTLECNSLMCALVGKEE